MILKVLGAEAVINVATSFSNSANLVRVINQIGRAHV